MFEEQLDKLILRITFCGLFIAILWLYKYVYHLFYLSPKKQMSKNFYPSLNSSDTIHYMARILGFGIVFSYIHINLEHGILFAFAHLLFQSFLVFVIYLSSLALSESIALYNFTYSDEITKRKNLCYGVIHFAHSISLAIIIREVFEVAHHSLLRLLFLWLYSNVTFGLAIKLYHSYSKLSFNKLVSQKNMAIGLSYSGYILGCALLISSALTQTDAPIDEYLQLISLKILLTVLIFPIFIVGLKKVFLFKDHTGIESESSFDPEEPEIGYGLYEGVVFLTASLLTTVLTGHLLLGIFYRN